MKKNKLQKKEQKKNKKILDIVKKEFGHSKTKNKDLPAGIINIANAVRVNNALIAKDKLMSEVWEESYYAELFQKFKNLVKEHNDTFKFKADSLNSEVQNLTKKVKTLKAEIKRLEAEKELKESESK